MEDKQDIRLLNLEELTKFFETIDEKAFRAKQVYEWVWTKSVKNFVDMTNLSKELRDKLEANFYFTSLTVDELQTSSDGTIKSRFRLNDNNMVEGVLIPSRKRMTACISSQVGCSLACKFCATGFMDLKKNLTPGEIYDQVITIKNQASQEYDMSLSNIVYMGMGEPLLNYKNVLKSIEYITAPAPHGLGMSPKRITVSTAGIAKMIRKLADDDVKFNLAISLHAATDEKRDKIMPINETNTLANLLEALQYFNKKTGTRITLEYIAFDGFNDGIEDAKELAKFATSVPTKINIIEYNSIEFSDFEKSKPDNLNKFVAYLEERNLAVNVRRSRGKDIDAACGQLTVKSPD